MAALNVIRVVLQVVATLVLLAAIGFVIAGILTTGWQTYTEPGTGERHQHGLWLDFTLVKMHTAGSGDQLQWTWKYKFGDAVKGDEVHKAQPFQVNTLILLVVGTFLAIIALMFSFCSSCFAFASIGWALSTLFAGILSTAGIILFYVTAMLPEHRYVYTDRKIEQVIGYSFWISVIGTAGYGVAMLLSVVVAILTFIAARTGHKPAKTYPKINHAHNTVV